MGNSKRTYTKEFKQDAIKLALKSPSVLAAASNLGIPSATLNGWVKAKLNKTDKKATDDSSIYEEFKKLRKENSRLKEEREILKKAATFFAKESK